MFNGNFMTKLRQSNAGQHQVNDADSGGMSSFGQSQKNDNGRIGTTNGVVTGQNNAHLFNLVNQRKTPSGTGNQNIMMQTT